MISTCADRALFRLSSCNTIHAHKGRGWERDGKQVRMIDRSWDLAHALGVDAGKQSSCRDHEEREISGARLDGEELQGPAELLVEASKAMI